MACYVMCMCCCILCVWVVVWVVAFGVRVMCLLVLSLCCVVVFCDGGVVC